MKEKINVKRSYIILLSVFLTLGMLVVFFATAYARFQTSTQRDVSFQVAAPADFNVTTGSWEADGTAKRLIATITNENEDAEFTFTVRLATTLGIKTDRATVSVVLTDKDGNETSYKGTSSPIETHTALYERMGEGYVYSFYETNSLTELTWTIASGQTQEVTFEIKGEDTISMTEVIVTGTKQAD